MTYFLDTNVCITLLKGSPAVARELLAHAISEIGLPAIVASELLVGAAKSARAPDNLTAVRAFLRPLTVAPFDYECAERYATVRAGLERAGTTIGPHDLLIAATVLTANGTLVTHNLREFSRVPDLRVVDWE
ncbi:MAG: type II toxin-antitoxin system VapC family toxin [Propionibacteriaceae bacterium]|nr:type II toxin-antitoxin system VapC family toxin [Propionibacteriaceae bacterium]